MSAAHWQTTGESDWVRFRTLRLVRIRAARHRGNPADRDPHLRCNPAAEARLEESFDVRGTFASRCRQCTADVVFPPTGDQIPNHVGIDPPIEHAQLARHGVGKGQVGRRREALDSISSAHHGGPGEADEYRLSKMWMPK